MKIFVSYRRSDTPDVSGRIYDELARHFGAETVFKDVDDIPLGVNFARYLHQIIEQSSVMLIVIGRDWLNVADERGQRRLDQPGDFVQIEVKAAMERELPIVPLLVQGATMPQESELPAELATLSLYNGTRIRPDPDFHTDMSRLIRQIEPYLKPAAAGTGTVSQPARAAAQARQVEEKAVQARLDALYDEAVEAYFTHRWARAIELLSEIVSVRKDYPGAANYLERARRELGLEQSYTCAVQAYDAQDWDEAIRCLQEVQAIDPGYEDVSARLQEATRRRELAGLYADAQRLHRAQSWQAVVNAFQAIHRIEPDHPDPDGLLASARAEWESEQRAERSANLYGQGLSHLSSQEWAQAVHCFEQVAQIEPGYRETETLLARARREWESQEREQRLEELYSQGLSHVEVQEWPQALACFEQVTRIEPEYRDTDALLAQVRKEVAAAAPSIQTPDLPASPPAARFEKWLGAGPGAQRWPIWTWAVIGVLALLLVGGGILGVRALRVQSAARATATSAAGSAATATGGPETPTGGAETPAAVARVSTATPTREPALVSTTTATAIPATPTETSTTTPTATRTSTPEPTPTQTSTATPTATRAPTKTSTPKPTATPTPTKTSTPRPTATPTVTPTATSTWIEGTVPKLGDTRVRAQDGAVMVYVPAGEFWMGSDTGVSQASPRHRVAVDGFWIDRTEVTNAQYRRCLDAGACSGPVFLPRDPQYDDHPVVNVGWDAARLYAEWVGGRLPTEAEWEYAACGPEGSTYPWGARAPDASLLNYDRNEDETTPVGAYPRGASWVGALDMSGNVWEWTSSMYKPYPYNASDGREDARTGADLGVWEGFVQRGGSFTTSGGLSSCTFRLDAGPGSFNSDIGFRVSLSPAVPGS